MVEDKPYLDLYAHLIQTSFKGKSLFTNKISWLAVELQVTENIPNWKKVLKYCSLNHLQAVVDEWFALEYENLSAQNGELKKAHDLIKRFEFAFNIPLSNPEYYEVDPNTNRPKGKSVRRHISQAFIDSKSASASDMREESHHDQLREAFNSPFWPQVLITTSVGQEGLDFHRYCSDIIHWNLPYSPVAFEQREGRINRYLGQSIRRAIIEEVQTDLKELAKQGGHVNLWFQLIKDLKEKCNRDNFEGLAPWWIHEYAKISRHLLAHPFSDEAIQYTRMKDSMLLYRMALGQPRGQDFIDVIGENIEKAAVIKPRAEIERMAMELWLDLCPGRK